MDADEIMGSGGSSIELWLSGGDEQVAQVTLQRRVWEELRKEHVLAGADLLVEGLRGVRSHIVVSSPIHSHFTRADL